MSSTFANTPNRRAFHSVKWSVFDEDVLPMWVADTDFASPQPIIDALAARCEHGDFGYGLPPEELGEAICDRLDRLYDWHGHAGPDRLSARPGQRAERDRSVLGPAGGWGAGHHAGLWPLPEFTGKPGRALHVAELAR